ncbi:acyltransferase [Microbacterium sp.]|uniref:acyltransferase n=1 Tax=Microbacterium sp. TaxID=51671 RepID=UPI0039E4BE01
MGITLWLKKRADDLELISIKLASYSPVHIMRVSMLRAWGAKISPGVTIHHGLEVRRARRLTIGRNTSIGDNAILDARGGLTIGDHVNLSSGVNIWTAEHDWQAPSFGFVSAPVSVGDRVWLSARVTLLPGTRIEEGAVVAAGAVVTKAVDRYTVVGGVPARVIARRPYPMEYELRTARSKNWWW